MSELEANIKHYPDKFRALGEADYVNVRDQLEHDLVIILAGEEGWESANLDAAYLLARIQDVGSVWQGKSIIPWLKEQQARFLTEKYHPDIDNVRATETSSFYLAPRLTAECLLKWKHPDGMILLRQLLQFFVSHHSEAGASVQCNLVMSLLIRYPSREGNEIVVALLSDLPSGHSWDLVRKTAAEVELRSALVGLSKEAAWSLCINRSAPNSLEAVMTDNTKLLWYGLLSAMREVVGPLDPDIPIKLATNENPEVQYVLLYGAICSINSQFLLGISHAEPLLKAIEVRKKVMGLLGGISAQVSAAKQLGGIDYLGEAMASLEKRIEKESHEQ